MRGSTVAITDMCGNVIDTFRYDTYGKVTEHIGNSFVIFGYNGRDGVVTDKNGLIYMRARYYSPEMKRFVNADILHGTISDSTSLNRYAYANGNPVSFVDPFGLSATPGVSDYMREEIEKILGGIAGIVQLNEAQLAILNLFVNIDSSYSLKGSLTLDLGKIYGADASYELEVQKGSSEIAVDINKLLKFESSKNFKEFLDSSELLQLELELTKNFPLDNYTTYNVSNSVTIDALKHSVEYTLSVGLEYEDEHGNSISGTFKFKRVAPHKKNAKKPSVEKDVEVKNTSNVSTFNPGMTFTAAAYNNAISKSYSKAFSQYSVYGNTTSSGQVAKIISFESFSGGGFDSYVTQRADSAA